jgi:HEAT repeat protein
MKWKLKIALATLVLIIAAVSLVALRQPRDPEYDGQPLSYYLSSLTYSQVRLEGNARSAIREIGSNAVPPIIEILNARESRFKIWFNEMADHQSFIRFRFAPLVNRQMQAAMACGELGPLAAPAIPSLARLVDDPVLGNLAVAALADIGPQTFPLLTNALTSRSVYTRLAAVGHLRLMRPRERALPLLLATLRNEESAMRVVAAESLGALGLRTPEVVGALSNALADPNMDVRLSAARGLGWCGESAACTVPLLIELHRSLEGTAEQQHVTEALASIDPVAAQRATIAK